MFTGTILISITFMNKSIAAVNTTALARKFAKVVVNAA